MRTFTEILESIKSGKKINWEQPPYAIAASSLSEAQEKEINLWAKVYGTQEVIKPSLDLSLRPNPPQSEPESSPAHKKVRLVVPADYDDDARAARDKRKKILPNTSVHEGAASGKSEQLEVTQYAKGYEWWKSCATMLAPQIIEEFQKKTKDDQAIIACIAIQVGDDSLLEILLKDRFVSAETHYPNVLVATLEHLATLYSRGRIKTLLSQQHLPSQDIDDFRPSAVAIPAQSQEHPLVSSARMGARQLSLQPPAFRASSDVNVQPRNTVSPLALAIINASQDIEYLLARAAKAEGFYAVPSYRLLRGSDKPFSRPIQREAIWFTELGYALDIALSVTTTAQVAKSYPVVLTIIKYRPEQVSSSNVLSVIEISPNAFARNDYYKPEFYVRCLQALQPILKNWCESDTFSDKEKIAEIFAKIDCHIKEWSQLESSIVDSAVKFITFCINEYGPKDAQQSSANLQKFIETILQGELSPSSNCVRGIATRIDAMNVAQAKLIENSSPYLHRAAGNGHEELVERFSASSLDSRGAPPAASSSAFPASAEERAGHSSGMPPVSSQESAAMNMVLLSQNQDDKQTALPSERGSVSMRQ